MPLGGVQALLFVDLIQDQVVKEPAQVPLDEQGRLVTADLPGHLPER